MKGSQKQQEMHRKNKNNEEENQEIDSVHTWEVLLSNKNFSSSLSPWTFFPLSVTIPFQLSKEKKNPFFACPHF